MDKLQLIGYLMNSTVLNEKLLLQLHLKNAKKNTVRFTVTIHTPNAHELFIALITH